MKTINILKTLMILVSFYCFTSAAAEKPENLIEGCKQLVQLSEAKEEGGVLEFFTKLKDSPKDSMLAGYCQGVIDSFVKFGSDELSYCRDVDPILIAKHIAAYEPSKDINYDGRYDFKDVLIGGCI